MSKSGEKILAGASEALAFARGQRAGYVVHVPEAPQPKAIPMIDDEYDALTRDARRALHWRAGQIKAAKRSYWRRFRQRVRRWLKGQQE